MGNYSKVVYDAQGRPIKTYLPDRDTQETTQNWSNNLYTTATYDLKGNVKSTTDIKGMVTNYAYDSMDRLTSTTQVVTGGNIVSSSTYSTYTRNNKTCLKMIYTDPEGVKSVEYYDELGRVIETKVSDGTTWQTRGRNTYDSAGNLKTQKSLISSDGTNYSITTYEYDKLNRLTKTITPKDSSNVITTKTYYDYAGNVTREIDAESNSTYYQYDKLGRIKKVTQNGNDTEYSYDNVVEYYGVNFLMNSITDANDHVKETYLNELGQAVLEINQGDTTTTKSIKIRRFFNPDGTIKQIKQPKVNQASGETQDDYYEYNNWGQVTRVQYETQNANGTNNQTKYTYNDHGQMSLMEDRRSDPLFGGLVAVDTSWTYDVLGRVASVTQDGVTIQYEFDKAGKITKLIQPDDEGIGERTTTYTYNGLGQLDKIYQSKKNQPNQNNLVREYEYEFTGQIDYVKDYVDFVYGNTTDIVKTVYSYTKTGQVNNILYTDLTDPQVTWPDNLMEQYLYEYDKNGNITRETLTNRYEKDDNGNPVTNTTVKDYTYDSLNRLSTVTQAGDKTENIYDAVGNKTQEKKYENSVLKSTDTNVYNELNQLVSTTKSIPYETPQAIAMYGYDDRGNQILAHKRDFGATTWYNTTYDYDRAGYMQKSVEEKPGGITETVGHYYNGMEQRIRKVVDQNTTKYVYTGTTVLFTADDNNDKITENILSPGGQIVASNRFDGIFNGNAFFFNQDIRNSTTAIINKGLEALKYYEYDEQGREEEKGNPNFINENTFTGAISEGGNIFYMNARFYDANTGRFLSQDSYTGNAYEPWSQHLYSYCGNNPVNMIDPTGHFARWFRRKKRITLDTDMVDALNWIGEDDKVKYTKSGGDQLVDDMLTVGQFAYGVTTPMVVKRNIQNDRDTFYANVKNIIAAYNNQEEVLLYPMGSYNFDSSAFEDILGFEDRFFSGRTSDSISEANGVFANNGFDADVEKSLDYMKGQYWNDLTDNQKGIFSTLVEETHWLDNYLDSVVWAGARNKVWDAQFIYNPFQQSNSYKLPSE